MQYYETFEDEQVVWTPAGNQSLKDKEIAEQMFGNSGATRPITIIVEAKLVDDEFKDWQYSNILTKEAF